MIESFQTRPVRSKTVMGPKIANYYFPLTYSIGTTGMFNFKIIHLLNRGHVILSTPVNSLLLLLTASLLLSAGLPIAHCGRRVKLVYIFNFSLYIMHSQTLGLEINIT